MIRWPDGPTSSDVDSTCRIGRKKTDEDQLQPTVRNTLRKLSRPMKKNCPTADRRLEAERCYPYSPFEELGCGATLSGEAFEGQDGSEGRHCR
ncbi:hypothetical protein DPX16_10031 [Anabarilius grahami]|uniref:Uncharacterized protein n=1 Tax=Anabarilius grahami TaxID=495550 RepID=A0A3N0XX69_ANAGA|nr:hypothetical protein DPX16_10031 [Anabarilius grahami]